MCGSYRDLKLLEHAMKVWERLIEERLRDRICIEEEQFGFVKSKGRVDALFIVKRLQEKYLEKDKNLYLGFADPEKAFDRVPKDVVEWAQRKKNVEEVLVKAVMASYDGAMAKVRVGGGVSEEFDVKVGVHQGTILSPLLFINVLDVVSKDEKRVCHGKCCMLMI